MHNLFIRTKPVAVIFAGGGGTRLWPVSTHDLPKQINPVFSKKTLLKEAFERASKIFPKERIVVVTTKDLEEKVKKIIKLPAKNFLVQPKNSDTAMAMCFTALYLETMFPESVAVVFYSDQKIIGFKDFKKAISNLVEAAKKHSSLLTIGTWPTMPSTQLGYIKIGKKKKCKNVYEVDAFREKPDLETANKYLSDAKHVWNTGVYAWKTSVFLSVLKKVAPDLYAGLVETKLFLGGDNDENRIADWFKKTKPTSFEKAVSEKLSDMLVYVADYSWSDIGNWKTFYELSDKDKAGNVVLKIKKGEIKMVNSSRDMVVSDSKKTALIGIKDSIVIHSGDSLLVCNINEVDSIKTLKDFF